jgi:hypothetical protein
MIDRVTTELLDLQASELGPRRARLAFTLQLCCCTSCCVCTTGC